MSKTSDSDSNDPDTLLQRDARVFIHQTGSTPCIGTVRRAQGIWLEDSTGRRYMDFHGNSVHHIGYGHPKLIAALKRQLDDLPFTPRRFTSEPAVRLAEFLVARSPIRPAKVLFAPSGSDAIEIALKLARAATQRWRTLSFQDSYHGHGFGALSLGGSPQERSAKLGPLVPGAEQAAPFFCYRCPYGFPAPVTGPELDVCGMACAATPIETLVRAGDFAAVVAEPMRSWPVPAPPGFWSRVREACSRTGTLLVFDEIPTGLGKTGRFFAHEHESVIPDIIVLGKALGGGVVPLAAVIARADLDVAPELAIGHYTHEKNPVCAAAGLATLEIIDEERLVERAEDLGRRAQAKLQALQERHRVIGSIRGRGLLFGVDLVVDRGSRVPAVAAAQAAVRAAFEAGLNIKISGASTLALSPPLVIAEAELDAAIDIVDRVLARAVSQKV